jgi:hypothetical protein
MARTRKKKHQLLSNLVLGTLVFMMLGMIAGGLAQSILIFMLTGYITGTDYVVPVWGMFCLYGGIAAFLVLTYAIDKELENKYVKKIRTTGKLPRRRYSHI